MAYARPGWHNYPTELTLFQKGIVSDFCDRLNLICLCNEMDMCGIRREYCELCASVLLFKLVPINENEHISIQNILRAFDAASKTDSIWTFKKQFFIMSSVWIWLLSKMDKEKEKKEKYLEKLEGFKTCVWCKCKNESVSQIGKHFIEHHVKNTLRKSFTCPLCKTSILKAFTHLKKHHPHHCEFCLLPEPMKKHFECNMFVQMGEIHMLQEISQENFLQRARSSLNPS